MARCAVPVFAVCTLLASASGLSAQSREFTNTADLQPGGSLRIVGTKGSMRVTSWERNQVDIRARIDRPDDVDDDYAARAVAATRIDVTTGSGSVTVASNYDDVPEREGSDRRGRRYHNRSEPPVHYEIRAPRNIRLTIDSDRGPVEIGGFDGPVDVDMDRGELSLRDVNGDVHLEIDRGDRSRIQDIRGSLSLNADRTDVSIDAQTLERNSRIEADRGKIELRLPAAQRLTVRTDISRRGEFRSDLPIQWTSQNERHGEGHINGGGTELFVESDRATIELRRK